MTRRHRPEHPSTTSRSCLLAAQENNVIKRYSPFLPKSACQGKHGGAPSRGSFGKFKSNLVPPPPVPLPPCTPAPAAAIFGVRGGAASQVTQPSPAQPSPAQPRPSQQGNGYIIWRPSDFTHNQPWKWGFEPNCDKLLGK